MTVKSLSGRYGVQKYYVNVNELCQEFVKILTSLLGLCYNSSTSPLLVLVSNQHGIWVVEKSNKADSRLLRLNVGFLLKESAGYSRDFDFDEPGTLLAEDVVISHLLGKLRLTRTPQGILVQGTLEAKTGTECTRCLKPLLYTFQVELSELFTLDNSGAYVIDDGDTIDLTPILREEGILSVPMQVLCNPDCKGLCPECGCNLNEGSCDCVSESIDPRLALLRTLLED